MSEPATLDAPVSDPAPAIDPAPVADPPTEPTGIFGEGLAFRDGWFNGVEDPSFDPFRSMAAQFKDLPSVFKSLHDTKAALSQRQDGMVKLPGANATEAEIAAWRAATGVPESPDAYDIKVPEKLPEGIDFKPETLTAFREFAHKAGISNALANQLIEFQIQAESAEIANIEADHRALFEAEDKKLMQEWGGRWEQKNMLAKRAAETFGLGADHPAMKSADVRKAMAQVAEMISEDKLVAHDSVSTTLTPGNEAKDILANPDNPLNKAYHDPSHPNHEHAVQTYMKKMEEQVRREGGR